MDRNPHPYTPSTIGEVMNLLGSMMLEAPTFKDPTGYFPDRNITSEFISLNSGLEAIRKKVGEDNYGTLVEISSRMQAHFEAGLRDQPAETSRGRACIREMEDILRSVGRRKH